METLPGLYQLAKTADGVLLYNPNDIYVGRSIALYGEYNGEEAELLARLLGPGNVVVEVGANIGSHTIGLAKAVGPKGRVFAYEAQRGIHQMLCANAALNGLLNIEAYHGAISDENGHVMMPEIDYSQHDNFGGVNIEAFDKGRPVQKGRLDDVLHIPRLNLLKVDVEGMEEKVLRGAEKLIKQFLPFIYVENDRIDQSESLIRYMWSLDYQCYWHTPRLFRPNNFAGNSENVFDNIGSINMICLHKDSKLSIGDHELIADATDHILKKS